LVEPFEKALLVEVLGWSNFGQKNLGGKFFGKGV
jgi:hypothetical protein